MIQRRELTNDPELLSTARNSVIDEAVNQILFLWSTSQSILFCFNQNCKLPCHLADNISINTYPYKIKRANKKRP